LGAYAQRKLVSRGIEILTKARVATFEGGRVRITDGRLIQASTLVWTAGNAGNPLVAALALPSRGGRVLVNGYLEVENVPNLWALGDCALVPDLKGGFHPLTAQHALRQGRALGRNIEAALRGKKKRPFRFSTLGQLAAIGRRTGVANVFGIRCSGFIAWWLWRTVYLSKLPRFEKKLRVALDWTLDLCFSKDFACISPPTAAPISVGTETTRPAQVAY
jgi:NADH dehydrogenase